MNDIASKLRCRDCELYDAVNKICTHIRGNQSQIKSKTDICSLQQSSKMRSNNWLEDVLVKNNKVHLCDSCCKHIADCDADNILFGDSTGYDNVCCCASYEPLLERDHDRGGYK